MLLDRWRGGDAAAGNQLFERHFDGVYRFFVNKVQGDAADLVQRTFLACVEGKDRFREESSFRAYLFGIARHELYAHWRHAKRVGDLDVGSSSIVDLRPSPSELILKRREDRLLLEALRSIPLELQLAIELYYWERLTGPDLARVLGVPEGTARSRVRRGLEGIRDKLAELDAIDLGSTVEDVDSWAASLQRLREALEPA